MKSGVSVEVNDAAILAALKRLDPESAKALRKELNAIGTEGKRRIVAGSPLGETGRMRGAWSKKSTFNQSRIEQAITIKGWPTGLARYPFILEHGRKAGPSPKTGRMVTQMAPRPLIRPTREAMFVKAAMAADRVRREAVRILGS